MSRRPNYAILLRVAPLVLAVIAILVMKQRCGDSTAKMFQVVTDTPATSPRQAPPAAPADLGRP